MKPITKIITLMLVLLLIPPFVLPVQAQSGNNWPNPNFMASATPAGKTSMPYYDLDSMIDIYLSDGLSYYVDEDTQAVVQIFTPDEYLHETTTDYSEDQLRNMAETIAYSFIKGDTRLESLSFSLGQKMDNYFFHWDDTSKQLYDGTHPFIQIGLSQNGDFLNLVNTLPFSKTAGGFDVSQTTTSASQQHFTMVSMQMAVRIGRNLVPLVRPLVDGLIPTQDVAGPSVQNITTPRPEQTLYTGGSGRPTRTLILVLPFLSHPIMRLLLSGMQLWITMERWLLLTSTNMIITTSLLFKYL